MPLTAQQKKEFIEFDKKNPGAIARYCRMDDGYADYLIKEKLGFSDDGYQLMLWFRKKKVAKLRSALRDGFFNSDDYDKTKNLGYNSDEMRCWIMGRQERQELGIWFDAWRMLGSEEA